MYWHTNAFGSSISYYLERDLLKIEFEADKKIALAETKLELADMKNKYAEAFMELNTVKQELLNKKK